MCIRDSTHKYSLSLWDNSTKYQHTSELHMAVHSQTHKQNARWSLLHDTYGFCLVVDVDAPCLVVSAIKVTVEWSSHYDIIQPETHAQPQVGELVSSWILRSCQLHRVTSEWITLSKFTHTCSKHNSPNHMWKAVFQFWRQINNYNIDCRVLNIQMHRHKSTCLLKYKYC